MNVYKKYTLPKRTFLKKHAQEDGGQKLISAEKPKEKQPLRAKYPKVNEKNAAL